MLKKKIWPILNFVRTFCQKIVNKLSKIWVRDPGYGKNLFRIPDPGVKKEPDPGSGSATLPLRNLILTNLHIGSTKVSIFVRHNEVYRIRFSI